MKHLLILTIGISLLISMPVMADQAADEAAILELSKKVHAAYNSHDAKALVALYDETHEFWDGTEKGRLAETGEGPDQAWRLFTHAHTPGIRSGDVGTENDKPRPPPAGDRHSYKGAENRLSRRCRLYPEKP